MVELEDWTDTEWAKHLDVSERTAREYFLKGYIHGAYKNSRGEWRAAGNGLSTYLTWQTIARKKNWKQHDDNGDFINPDISSELKEAFKPFFDSRTDLVIRYAQMMRVASAYSRAVRLQPIEQNKLDEFEETIRWQTSSPTPSKIPSKLKPYEPLKKHIKFIRSFFDKGQMKRAEVLVAMVSAINSDGIGLSGILPSAYGEWVKILGRRPTGKYPVVYEENDSRFTVETKPNKSSKRRFKQLKAAYGGKDLVRQAYGLHPDHSDVLNQYENQSCHEGAAHWDVDAQRAMDC